KTKICLSQDSYNPRIITLTIRHNHARSLLYYYIQSVKERNVFLIFVYHHNGILHQKRVQR
ncbi:MAG: hypothetical protein KBB20_07190, partial [Bacteroidales bacterium]|nr:hypothetical protein [Bacteroidales bacterium]